MNCYYCGEPLTSDDYKLDRIYKFATIDLPDCHSSCLQHNHDKLNSLSDEQWQEMLKEN